MMTEEEAKAKWCPFARVRNSCLDEDCLKTDIELAPTKGDDYGVVAIAPFAGPAYNRFVTSGGETADDWISPDNSCIASQCMAWRWQPTHINNPEGGDMIWSARTYGFCGLAGESKPLPVGAPR